MRKFTLFVIAALLSVVTFAQKQRVLPQAQRFERTLVKTAVQKTLSGSTAAKKNRVAKVVAGTELVTLPEGATPEVYYTTSGTFYAGTSTGWEDATADMKSVNVAVVGSDIYVQGLAYWFLEGWIKGSLDGTTATFPSGQLVGEDEYGPEYLVGSEDGATVSENIVFAFDATEGVLTATTALIVESGSAESLSPYCYWNSPVFSKEEPAGPELVVLPAGVELVEYALS